MPGMNDFYAFKSTSGGSGGGRCGGNRRGDSSFGCGWVVIVIAAIMLITATFRIS